MAIFVRDFKEKIDFVLSSRNLNMTQSSLALELIVLDYCERHEKAPTGDDLQRVGNNYETRISVWRHGDLNKGVDPGLIQEKYLPMLASILKTDENTLIKLDLEDFKKRWKEQNPDLSQLEKQNEFIREYKKNCQSRLILDLDRTGLISSPKDFLMPGLEHFYQKTRVYKGYSLKEPNLGNVFNADYLLENKRRNYFILGYSGSGKTTLSRWLFHELLKMPHVLPFRIEGSKLLNKWDSHQEEKTFRGYLEAHLKEYCRSIKKKDFRSILDDQSENRRLVIIIDGLDELSIVSADVFSNLYSFMDDYPELQIVVTSRPLGKNRVTRDERFDWSEIQPFSDDDIERFTKAYYYHYKNYKEKPDEELKIAVDDFNNKLNLTPDAREMAREPLLLEMMLIIADSGQLPSMRHELYDKVINNFLISAIDRAVEQEYKSCSVSEHKQFLGKLAFKMQKRDYSTHFQKKKDSIEQKHKEISKCLPKDWLRETQDKYLDWIENSVHLMSSQNDHDNYVFCHKSFQEFLAAFYLDCEYEGAARKGKFLKLCKSENWWTTLVLWMSLIDEKNHTRVDKIIKKLIKKGPQEADFCSILFAAGFGSNTLFEKWLFNFIERVQWGWTDTMEHSSDMWPASHHTQKNELRQQKLGEGVDKKINSNTCSWLGWFRYRALKETKFFKVGILPRPLPTNAVTNHMISAWIDNKEEISPEYMAVARILCASDPIFPKSSLVGCINLWPSHRRIVGLRLQAMINSGATQEDIFTASPHIFNQNKSSENFEKELNESASFDLIPPDFFSKIAINLYDIKDSCSNQGEEYLPLIKYLRKSWFHNANTRYIPNELSQTIPEIINSYLSRIKPRNLKRHSPPGFIDNYAKLIGFKNTPLWFENFMMVDVGAIGYCASQYVFSKSNEGEGMREPEKSIFKILTIASKLYLKIDNDPDALHQAIEQYSDNIDPIWKALARYLANCSNDNDQKYLTDLAKAPEECNDPLLASALKYIVRGDIWFNENYEMQLDEIAVKLGLPLLPYLDPI
ncbi:MAG: NACHT domain-containing protein [Methylococcales bacterium]